MVDVLTVQTDIANQLSACEASIAKLQSDRQRLQQQLTSVQVVLGM